MFFRSAIIKGLAKIGLALNRHLVEAKSHLAEARREHDRAVAKLEAHEQRELEAHNERFDRLPAALHSLTTERDALRKQRDQAYGEIDDLCRERNELKGQLERLKRPDR